MHVLTRTYKKLFILIFLVLSHGILKDVAVCYETF